MRRFGPLGALLALVVATLVSGAAHAANGVTWTPASLPDVTASAVDATGAPVSYSPPTAVDASDNPLTVDCEPASGSTFAIGTTPVTCSASDSTNTVLDTLSFNVTVADTTGPVVSVPASVSVDATGPMTPVSFSASASDNVDGPVPVSCAPSSGSGFAVGTTTVNCSATDAAGNPGSGSFQVTVADVTPPVVSVPSNMNVSATGASTPVSFSASATDAVDGSVPVSCAPSSGSGFALGTTSVSCSATDAAGNKSTESFQVTVADSLPTFTNVPATIVVEADGPSGSVVDYTAPSATDVVDGGVPVTCAPASGSTFALGTTTVKCSATNSSHQTATASFLVTVRDTTPPVLPNPGTLTITTGSALPSTYAQIAAWLDLKATDGVDPSPTVTNNAPSLFPIGKTAVTFTALDASGNQATAVGLVVLVKPSVSQSTPSAAKPSPKSTTIDRTPPADVSQLKAVVSGRVVTLSWALPTTPDFDHLTVSRSVGTAAPSVIYTGHGTRYVDRGLTAGVRYRYLIVTYDHSGNRSTGVVAIATTFARDLFAPFPAQHVGAPVVLRWRRVAGARFYNVQVYRGRTKQFSAWPKSSKLILPRTWKVRHRVKVLKPGTYTWYVWPATGTRKKPHYRALLGSSTFVVVAT